MFQDRKDHEKMSFPSADGRQCGSHAHPDYSSGLCSSFRSLERRGQPEEGVSHVNFMDWERAYIACYSAFPPQIPRQSSVSWFLCLASSYKALLSLHSLSTPAAKWRPWPQPFALQTLNSLTQCQLPQAQPPAGPGSRRAHYQSRPLAVGFYQKGPGRNRWNTPVR